MAQVASATSTLRVEVLGMHCAGCAASARRAIERLPGVNEATVDFASGLATIAGQHVEADAVAKAIRDAGFEPRVVNESKGAGAADANSDPIADLLALEAAAHRARDERLRRWRRSAIAGAALWLPLELLHWFGGHAHSGAAVGWWMFAGGVLALVLAGGEFYRSAWRALVRGATNMDTLVALGLTAAFGLSTFNLIAGDADAAKPLYFAEAAALMALVSLGHYLEARGSASAARGVEHLLRLQPRDVEVVEPAGGFKSVPLEAVVPGTRVLVRPGGRIGVDGRVVDGRASVDERSLTGEPLPRLRLPGDSVMAGAIALDGQLIIEATARGVDSAIGRIARLVHDAFSTEAPIQRLADRIASVFVPGVLGVAAITLISWLAIGSAQEAIVAAVTVLVISCPCALGIATPLAMMVGVGEASRRGILLRRTRAIESAAAVRRVVFDKTGTLTRGEPAITQVDLVGDSWSREQVLSLSASVELPSEHPIGRAIVALARDSSAPVESPSDFKTLPGVGVEGQVRGHHVAVRRDGEASARVEIDGTLVARFTAEDRVRPEAREAVDTLAKQGIEVFLLTGDRNSASLTVAAEVGIAAAHVHADQSPESKATIIKGMGRAGTIMVGDGINDAAALARASLGVAMGSGTGLASASADAILLRDDPRSVVELIWIARSTMGCVRQNLALAFAYNLAAIPLAALGMLGEHGPIVAAIAMGASDLCVVGNTLLLRSRLRRGHAAQGSGTHSPTS